MAEPDRYVPAAVARAQASALVANRLADRAEIGKKYAQKRVREVEEVIRDARKWMREHPNEENDELKRILNRAGVVRNDFALANRSKLDTSS